METPCDQSGVCPWGMVDLSEDNLLAWEVVEFMLTLGPEAGTRMAIAALSEEVVGDVAERVKMAWSEYNAWEREKSKAKT